ncbi:TAP-like protein-domain-containing protein [Trametes punicea]|nr:TAP-like protein-domain-containing protein [Trametes punicea]
MVASRDASFQPYAPQPPSTMTDPSNCAMAEKHPYDGSIRCNASELPRERTSRTKWFGRLAVLIGLYLACSTTFKRQFYVSNTTSTNEEYRVGDLKWAPCTGQHDVPGAECGYAIVPLDYFNASAGVAKIALGRYKATSANRLGSVFLNPGGPGGSGKGLATMSGPSFQRIVGEEYDMIGFDPRGIGETEPRTQCFPSPEAHSAFIANTVLERGYDVGPNLTDPLNRNHLIELQRDADALWQTQFNICAKTMGDKLRYMGTSTVARDIAFIASLLDGNDALIHFYGLSYGTVIGQYLVNMFPDRVGRVVIDGVVDAIAWTTLPAYKWERHWQTSTDKTYEIFMADCAKAGPSRCALAKKKDDDSASILSRVENFLQSLYYQPLAVPNATIPGILTNGRARLFLLGALESPSSWPSVAQAFDEAMNGDGSAVLNGQKGGMYLSDLERSAVSCNDNKPFPPPTPEEIIDEQLWVLENVSRFSLAVVVSEPDAGCQYWPVTPPERFLGPWNNSLHNPILIISNTADPATPIANGKLVQETLGNSSRLLVQDSPGHCSLALPSLCTIRAMRAFFANGTLPEEGTVCSVDASPFPQVETVKVYSAEDEKMLESARRAAEVVFGK